MSDSRLAVNYQDWSMFGQEPSLNHYFNTLVYFDDALETPYFYQGEYYTYYCLLDRSNTNGKPRF